MLLRYIGLDFKRLYLNKGLFSSVVKSIINPSFHAVVLIRFAQFSPSFLFWIFRNLLISKHAIDVGRGFCIGPGLLLPHPVSIVFGGGIVIDSNLTIYQGVTIGMKNGKYPKIGSDCTIFSNSVVVGNIEIGSKSTIGALQFIDYSVNQNMIVTGK